jgi:hypothetical protein
VHLNIDPAGVLTVAQIEHAVAELRADGWELIASDLESYPPTEREIELIREGDDAAELRARAEAACAAALAHFSPPAAPHAVAVTFISSGSHEDAAGIVRAFGLERVIEEVRFVDDDVAVLVLGGENGGPPAIGKLQTALECALNREILVETGRP